METQENLQAPETEPAENVQALPPEGDANGSAPEETGSANGQEPAGSEQDPAAQAPDITVEKGWKWDGDVEKLPDGMKERGRGMLRHFTEQSEKNAQEKRQLESDKAHQTEIAQLKKQQEPLKEPEVDPNELYLRREFQDAVESGDSDKLWTIQNKISDYRMQKSLQAIEPVYKEKMEKFERAQAESKNSEILKDFGEQNPTFNAHRKSDLAQFVVSKVCDQQGKSLEDANRKMDSIKNSIIQEYKRSLNQTVQEQKQAVSATPTTPMETKFVYASSQREADRMNLNFAADNSDKVAMVKKT